MAEISIGIASDTRAFAQGVKSGVLQPLEDVEKALDGVERASDDATTELVGGFKGAQRATKDLERENEKLADTIQREARKSSRAVKDIGDDGFNSVRDNVDGFKDEAIQNFSEVASSWDGSLQSMADGVQGLTGGLASALTPGIGIPVAILGAAAAAFLANWQASAEEAEQRISDMYDDFIESGQSFLSQQFIDEAIGELIKNTDDWNRIREESALIGEHESTLLRANAGDLAAVNEAITAAKDRRAELTAEGERFIETNGRENASITDNIASIDELIEKLVGMSDEQNTAASKANAARDAMDESAAANHRTADSLDRVSDSASKVPDGKTVVVTADTSQFDAAAERIRRTKFELTADVTLQRRGSWVP